MILTPLKPREFWIYYAIFTIVALILFLRGRRPRGMRLRLRGQSSAPSDTLTGRNSEPNVSVPKTQSGERSLNVVFNYNGHSWDAYEVLGIPAGSSPASVRAALAENLNKVDPTSRPFIEAAFQAIQAQWN